MGQTQSSPTDAPGQFFFMKPGDSFLYVIPVASAWKEKTGNDPGERFSPFEVTADSNYKYLIYKGEVTGRVPISDGSYGYTYNMISVSASTDGKTLKGMPTWTPSATEPDWWMNAYLQSRTTDSNGVRLPPSLTQYGADLVKDNLIPQIMPVNQKGLVPYGNFDDLSPDQIFKFINTYSEQSLSIIGPSHPFRDEIMQMSKHYTSNSQIRSEFADIRQKIRRDIGNPEVVLVTKDPTGIVRTKTTANDFLEKPFQSITRGNKTQSMYVGIEIDAGADYEGDYNNLQTSLDAYWEDVVARHGDEAVMPGVEMTGDVVMDTPDTTLAYVSNVRSDAFKSLLGRIRQLQISGNRVDGWTQKRVDGRVETTFFRRLFPTKTRIMEGTHTIVSGTTRGADGMSKIGSQVSNPRTFTTTAYKSTLSQDARFSPEKIRLVRDSYIKILAMLVAYQNLNPTEDGLFRSVQVAMGTSSASVDNVNAPTMWRYSQMLAAIVKSTDRAVADKVKRDSRGKPQRPVDNTEMKEGFTSGAPYKSFATDPLDSITTKPRADLLSAIEQNEAVVEQLAGAYTESSVQFAGMVAAAAVFVAISLLPKSSGL